MMKILSLNVSRLLKKNVLKYLQTVERVKRPIDGSRGKLNALEITKVVREGRWGEGGEGCRMWLL